MKSLCFLLLIMLVSCGCDVNNPTKVEEKVPDQFCTYCCEDCTDAEFGESDNCDDCILNCQDCNEYWK